MINLMQPMQSIQMPIINIQKPLCSKLTALPNHYLMLHRHWRINIVWSQRANNNILTVIHRHRETHLFARQLEEYSNEDHFSTVMAAIQYSETLPDTNLQNQDDFSPDFKAQKNDSYLAVQNPTKAPIISKDFLRALPHCPIIHWVSRMCNDPRLCFCPCSIHTKPWMEKHEISIHDDHGCRRTAMILQELLKHLKDEGDSTHTAISIYLEKLNTFS